jgi:hypothetical protein
MDNRSIGSDFDGCFNCFLITSLGIFKAFSYVEFFLDTSSAMLFQVSFFWRTMYYMKVISVSDLFTCKQRSTLVNIKKE